MVRLGDIYIGKEIPPVVPPSAARGGSSNRATRLAARAANLAMHGGSRTERNPGREKITHDLEGMSRGLSSREHDPYYAPDEIEIEDATYFHTLAVKNRNGTLSSKDAQEVVELFEEDNVIMYSSPGEGTWVEYVG